MTMYTDVQKIIRARDQALRDLLKATEDVIDLFNTYGKCDGTEPEFIRLRVVYDNAKKVE